MWKRLNLFSSQAYITKLGLIISGLFAIISISAWGFGHFQMWPAIVSTTLHTLWLAVAYKKKIKISRDGVELEEEDEEPKP